MIDYDFKEYILEAFPDLLRLEKKFRWCMFVNEDLTDDNGDVIVPVDDLKQRYQFLYDNSDVFKEAYKINRAKQARSNRLKDRISFYLNNFNNVHFLTLTFNDHMINDLTEDSRKQYIRKFLKKYCIHYVANIDYGGINGREHYHALCVCCPAIKFLYPYGFIDVKKVYNVSGDAARIAKYVAKLGNHALKDSTHQHRIIFSRDNFDYTDFVPDDMPESYFKKFY